MASIYIHVDLNDKTSLSIADVVNRENDAEKILYGDPEIKRLIKRLRQRANSIIAGATTEWVK